jgi:hypothetical protein
MHQIKKLFCRQVRIFFFSSKHESAGPVFQYTGAHTELMSRKLKVWKKCFETRLSFCMIKRPRLSETKRKETHFKEMNSMCTKSLLGSGNVSWICSEKLCLLMPLILQRNFLGQSQVRKCSSNQRFGERPCFHDQEADDMDNADLSYVYRVFLKWVQAYYT